MKKYAIHYHNGEKWWQYGQYDTKEEAAKAWDESGFMRREPGFRARRASKRGEKGWIKLDEERYAGDTEKRLVKVFDGKVVKQ